jgi:hypothetical protein
LARLTNRRVVNWSVGNYGVDQALLRLETKIAGTSSDWVIACVVPETICRIRSSWKHFFEYGNCLAFKPSFALVDGSLELKPTHRAPQSREEYLRNVDAARAEDYFYQRKFLRDTIRRPYVLSMLRRPLRHGGILLALLMSRVGPFEARGRRMAHGVVFRDNARWTRRLFGDTESLRLLRAILLRLQAVSCLHNRRFLLVVIPQFSELSSRPIRTPWTAYFDSLAAAADLEILDLTPTIASMPMRLRRRHYVTGTLGPHLSALGNSLVAALIRDHIETSSAKSQRS